VRELVGCLTLGALVTHLVIGCCWHHEHRADAGPAVAATEADSHDHDRPPCRSHERPRHRHDDCRGAKCVFVRPVNEGLSLESLSAPHRVALAPTAFSDVATQSSWRSLRSVIARPPSPRVHLLDQVLLI